MFREYLWSMKKRIKKPKRRIPLPKKIEKVHRDKSMYSRKDKHKKDSNGSN